MHARQRYAAIMCIRAPGLDLIRELSMPSQPLRIAVSRKQEVYPLEDDEVWQRLRAEAQQGLDNGGALASLTCKSSKRPRSSRR